MAFGNASLSTRKYVFGVRETLPRPRRNPTDPPRGPAQQFEGHEAAIKQLRFANDYQNNLIEIERARRECANVIVHARAPGLADLLVTAEALSAALETQRTEMSRRNSEAGRRGADREFAATVREIRVQSAAAWAAHRTAKAAAYADPTLRAELDTNDADATTAVTTARTAAIAGGLYWATAAIVAQRIKKSGPPPRFKRWEGEGLIAVQFQRKPDKESAQVPVLDSHGNPRIHPRSGRPSMRYAEGASLRTEDVFRPNTLCWLEPVNGGEIDGKKNRFAWVHFRVGSAANGAPVWAKAPAVVHRPFPAGAEVKWAYLSRRKIGSHYKWEVQFDVSAPEPVWCDLDDGRRERPEGGTVAVALGWRLIDGAVRVAVWVGDDGTTGEVVIPRERVEAWAYCDHLQSRRGDLFEASRRTMVEWLEARRERVALPPEWEQAVEHLPAWRSPDRFSRLIRWWRDHRLPGDEEAFAVLEGELVGVKPDPQHYTGGRKQDKHLLDWSENRRAKCRGWRKWHYRDVALGLSKLYRNVVVADIDWHAIAENPAPEEIDAEVNKRYRGMAAGAMLRDELTDLMVEVVVPAPGITVTCHVCKAVCDPPGRGRWVVCERCGGEVMDRAENAAKNLLARGLAASAANRPARVL